MARRRLLALVGGLVLLGGAVVVLRNESAPPPSPGGFERFLDERVAYVADTREPRPPTDLVLTALDRTSLRASWEAGGGIGYGGFEVRWQDRTRLVQGTETELTDLDVNAEVTVEVRAVGALGARSAPATATAVPRLAFDESWLEGLFPPVDVFDGPAALTGHRWRVLDDDCLGLRPFSGERVEVTCRSVDLQSNVPMSPGEPGADGAVGRVVLTTDGPAGAQGELVVALLPEPFQDLPRLDEHVPPGAVLLRITPQGARFDIGPGVPATQAQVPVAGTSTPPRPGVRHRWELRVRPDAVLALRDGEVVAAAPVAVPWRVARPRLALREAGGTLLDSFGTGGAPAEPEPARVVPLDRSPGTNRGTSLGEVDPRSVAGGTSARVVAVVIAEPGAPVTAELGARSAPAALVPLGPRTSLLVADFPLPAPEGALPVRVRGEGDLFVYDSRLVVTDVPDARRPPPRLVDLPEVPPGVPQPGITLQRDGDLARVAVELTDRDAREIAPVRGLELLLDGERIAALPAGGAAGGRHEFTLDTAGVPTGGHRLTARVLPADQRRDVRSAEHEFQIRPL
ncbi:fibronectin type III domain-containing protein [Saccharothrix syringae]|uniref:fibronectin type III domain-containing protein n=1 Tax=Saccharothrix syringae TaxID=103733 RepID=UPI000527D1AF|nr:fibronectin type III domain-containing protein [Saccharothrix syringae]